MLGTAFVFGRAVFAAVVRLARIAAFLGFPFLRRLRQPLCDAETGRSGVFIVFIVALGVEIIFILIFSLIADLLFELLDAGAKIVTPINVVFIDIIVNFLGVLLLVIGFLFVLFSIIMIARKNSPTFFMPIIEIVFGAILLAIGLTILILYYGSDIGMRNKVTLIVIGAVMAIAGLAQAIITGISLRKAKKANYTVSIEDVEVFDFDEEEKPHKDKKENKKLKKGDIIEIDSSEPKQIERKDK